jgi:hypothetical protein
MKNYDEGVYVYDLAGWGNSKTLDSEINIWSFLFGITVIEFLRKENN